MQELLHIFYESFVIDHYNKENKCTHPEIAKAILWDKNRGIEVTTKDGIKYKITCERINE